MGTVGFTVRESPKAPWLAPRSWGANAAYNHSHPVQSSPAHHKSLLSNIRAYGANRICIMGTNPLATGARVSIFSRHKKQGVPPLGAISGNPERMERLRPARGPSTWGPQAGAMAW